MAVCLFVCGCLYLSVRPTYVCFKKRPAMEFKIATRDRNVGIRPFNDRRKVEDAAEDHRPKTGIKKTPLTHLTLPRDGLGAPPNSAQL